MKASMFACVVEDNEMSAVSGILNNPVVAGVGVGGVGFWGGVWLPGRA